jgi:site-specific recombinase XerD
MSLPKSERMLCDYLESLRVRGLSLSTLNGRETALRRFLARLEKKEVRAVTRADVQAHAAFLLSCRFTAGTVRAHLLALRLFFAWLETMDALLVNPCVGVPIPKLPDQLPRRVLTSEEVARVLAQPDLRTRKGKRDRAFLELLYSSGLRRAEMAALTIHDLDLSNGMVRINCGKGGRGRLIPLGASAIETLSAYLSVRAEWLTERGQSENALWLSPFHPHKPLKIEALAYLVGRCAQRAGVGCASVHVWRHTCATHLMRGGAGLVYVQRLLGHRSLKTTQIYTRVTVTDVRAMVQKSHPRA